MDTVELRLAKDSSMIIKGPSRIHVDKGIVDVFGAIVPSGGGVTIVRGRQVPVTVIQDAKLKLVLGKNASYKIIDTHPIPGDWVKVVSKIKKLGKCVAMVIGDVDTGKSGFTLYAANKLISEGVSVAIVDTDIGQSDVGPPGTIGLAIINEPTTSYSDLPLKDAYFIGDKTPVGHLLPMVLGTVEMVNKAFKYGVEVVLINTTGLVYGGVALALKRYKIEAVKPNLIIALQRGGEVEHILKPYEEEIEIIRLSVPQEVVRKAKSERRGFRRLKMGQFLSEAKKVKLSLNNVILLNTLINVETFDEELKEFVYKITGRKPIKVFYDKSQVILVFREALRADLVKKLKTSLSTCFSEVKVVCIPRLRGLLIGLLDSGKKFMGVGILEEIDFDRGEIHVKSSVSNLDSIKYLCFGYLVLDEEGNEMYRLKPGSF